MSADSLHPGVTMAAIAASVILGSGGRMRRKGLDGRMYELLSTTVSGQSCAVRDGNLLAS
jgi:hypothetical protein